MLIFEIINGRGTRRSTEFKIKGGKIKTYSQIAGNEFFFRLKLIRFIILQLTQLIYYLEKEVFSASRSFRRLFSTKMLLNPG